jgi:hypothetical protein
LYVSDLVIPGNITVISSLDDLVARVIPPRIEEAEVVASTDGELTDGVDGEESADDSEGEGS